MWLMNEGISSIIPFINSTHLSAISVIYCLWMVAFLCGQNIQSTNWQTMRFKPPPPNSNIGWRVEFRPMEV